MKSDSAINTAEIKSRDFARFRNFSLATVVLFFCFGKSLYDLLRLAFNDQFYSYVPLIPAVGLYLVWLRKKNLRQQFQSAPKIAAIFFAAGLAAIVAGLLNSENALALDIFAFLFFFAGICALYLGKEFLRRFAFPLCLLVFIVPLPGFLQSEIDSFLQIGSAAVANALFTISGMPVIQDALQFHLPAMNLEVAPECSGIHSSWILFIVSLIAGNLFLRSPWKRAALAITIIPLALLRNGFRIFVIGQLCVHYGPQMLDSSVHRHGGPLFFALSLALFFPLLIFLKKSEPKIPTDPNYEKNY